MPTPYGAYPHLIVLCVDSPPLRFVTWHTVIQEVSELGDWPFMHNLLDGSGSVADIPPASRRAPEPFRARHRNLCLELAGETTHQRLMRAAEEGTSAISLDPYTPALGAWDGLPLPVGGDRWLPRPLLADYVRARLELGDYPAARMMLVQRPA